MDSAGQILDWISNNEAVLSGLAAMLAILGVIGALGYRAFGLIRIKAEKKADTDHTVRTHGSVKTESVSVQPALTSDKPSIAILPFRNMSADADKEYFADGLTEDIVMRLSQAGHLSVKSRSSTFGYKDRASDARQVGKDLGVSYIVDGSVRPVAERVRISVQLVNAITGDNLWTSNYDRPAVQIFDVQDDVISSITSALGANVTKAESVRAVVVQPNSLSAWEAVQRASFYRGASGNSEDETNKSIAELRKATEDAPEYAYAHSMLAWILYYRAINGLTDDWAKDFQEAAPHLEKGLALAPDDPFNLNICAGAIGYAGQAEKSIDICDRALAIDPNFADVYFNLGLAYTLLERYDEADEALDRVEQMAPGGPMSRYYDWYRALLRSREGRFVEAEKLLRATLEAAPDYTSPYVRLALALAELGQFDEAREMIRRVLRVNPRLTPQRLEIYVTGRNPKDGGRLFELLKSIWPDPA